MIPLHALSLILMGRYTSRLYVAYSSWYAIGTLASMQVPFVGFQPVRTSEHMGALGTFCSFVLTELQFIILYSRRIRSSADRRVCTTRPLACVVQAIPGPALRLRHCSRPHRHIWHRRIDIQGLDCTMDRSLLFSLGHRLRQKVGQQSLFFCAILMNSQVHPHHRLRFRASTDSLALILHGLAYAHLPLPRGRRALLPPASRRARLRHHLRIRR